MTGKFYARVLSKWHTYPRCYTLHLALHLFLASLVSPLFQFLSCILNGRVSPTVSNKEKHFETEEW